MASRTHSTAPAANGPRSLLERTRAYQHDPVLQRIRPKGIPLLYEDEGLEMGESDIHTSTTDVLLYGLRYHFAPAGGYRVFSNMNLFYSGNDPAAYVSPDVMVVRPPRPLAEPVSSYRIGQEGPAPVLVGEVLSPRTWQEGDLTGKPILYAEIGVEEYILADVTGTMLAERLLLLRRQRGRRWRDERDADGGVTSRLGFRVVIEEDGQLRVINVKSGKRYARPDEAQAATDRVAALEEELARLRGTGPKKGKGRRRKP